MDAIWYVAFIIMASTVEGESVTDRATDEQIRLIYARDADTAYNKAVMLGINEEHSYRNINGNMVHWKFIGLSELEELLDGEIFDGVEIHSRISTHINPDELVTPKEQLAVYISTKNQNDDT